MEHGTGTHEEQTLEEGVVHNMVKAGAKGQCGEIEHAVGLEEKREADGGQQQPDILDGGIGQQPLHVHLYGGEDHPKERGGQAERQQYHSPPGGLHLEKVEGHSQ